MESVSRNNDNQAINGEAKQRISVRIPAGIASLHSRINDPFVLSRPDVHDISATIGNDLVGTDHPVLNSAARYFFSDEDGGKGKGKQVRPVMVMLLSRAIMQEGANTSH